MLWSSQGLGLELGSDVYGANGMKRLKYETPEALRKTGTVSIAFALSTINCWLQPWTVLCLCLADCTVPGKSRAPTVYNFTTVYFIAGSNRVRARCWPAGRVGRRPAARRRRAGGRRSIHRSTVPQRSPRGSIGRAQDADGRKIWQTTTRRVAGGQLTVAGHAIDDWRLAPSRLTCSDCRQPAWPASFTSQQGHNQKFIWERGAVMWHPTKIIFVAEFGISTV